METGSRAVRCVRRIVREGLAQAVHHDAGSRDWVGRCRARILRRGCRVQEPGWHPAGHRSGAARSGRALQGHARWRRKDCAGRATVRQVGSRADPVPESGARRHQRVGCRDAGARRADEQRNGGAGGQLQRCARQAETGHPEYWQPDHRVLAARPERYGRWHGRVGQARRHTARDPGWRGVGAQDPGPRCRHRRQGLRRLGRGHWCRCGGGGRGAQGQHRWGQGHHCRPQRQSGQTAG